MSVTDQKMMSEATSLNPSLHSRASCATVQYNTTSSMVSSTSINPVAVSMMAAGATNQSTVGAVVFNTSIASMGSSLLPSVVPTSGVCQIIPPSTNVGRVSSSGASGLQTFTYMLIMLSLASSPGYARDLSSVSEHCSRVNRYRSIKVCL